MTSTATDTKGSYVLQVDVDTGRVDVMMGNRAHAEVSGKLVSFTPYLTGSGGVVWSCGYALPPTDTLLLRDASGTVVSTHLDPTIAERYLPGSCRD